MGGRVQGVRLQAASWTVAALIASAVPLLLLSAYQVFPGIRGYLALGSEPELSTSCDDDEVPQVYGDDEPLEGVSLMFASSAAAVFFGVGAAFGLRFRPKGSGWQEQISYGFTVTAITILLFVAPMLATVWALRLKDGCIPAVVPPGYDPDYFRSYWLYEYGLRKLLFLTIQLPIYALVPAILATVVKPRLSAFLLIAVTVVVLVGLLALYVALGAHYWGILFLYVALGPHCRLLD